MGRTILTGGVFETDLGWQKEEFWGPDLDKRYRTAVAVSSYFLVCTNGEEEAYREGVIFICSSFTS